jgi:hypothetical protein
MRHRGALFDNRTSCGSAGVRGCGCPSASATLRNDGHLDTATAETTMDFSVSERPSERSREVVRAPVVRSDFDNRPPNWLARDD